MRAACRAYNKRCGSMEDALKVAFDMSQVGQKAKRLEIAANMVLDETWEDAGVPGHEAVGKHAMARLREAVR